jgi:Skp family chaperone for outer membrane proteins
MQKLVLLLAICISSFAIAQTPKPATAPKPAAKIVIGYFNYDSLLFWLPGYKETSDTVEVIHAHIKTMNLILERRQNEYDSLSESWSNTIRIIKMQEITDLKNRIKQQTEDVKLKSLPFDLKLTAAVNSVAKAKKYSAVLDSKISDAFVMWATASGIDFVDITGAVYAELKSPTPAIQAAISSSTTKISIGYLNYDSLLLLIPGYKETADTIKTYRDQLLKFHGEVKRKQNEYDSLNQVWSPPISKLKEQEITDLKERVKLFDSQLDSTENAKLTPYELKLTAAIDRIAKAKGYSAALDSEVGDAFIVCTSSRMNFINMTAEICEELKIQK